MLAALLATILFNDPPMSAAESRPLNGSVGLIGGIQALGFKPFPANPAIALAGELRWLRRRYYSLHTGLALGYAGQLRLMHAGFVDLALTQRWTAPFGLYGAIDVVVGGQLGFVAGPQYAVRPGSPPQRVTPAPHGSARLGLGLELGVDTSPWMRTPIRVFTQYRQLALTPFMPGNDLAAMGVATWTVGVAVQFGAPAQ